MAKQLENFRWDEHQGRSAPYPWEEWQNGQPWLILQSTDFDVSLKSMQSQLYLRSRRTGIPVRTLFQEDPPGVVFQFFPDRARPPAEEPVEQPPTPPARKRAARSTAKR